MFGQKGWDMALYQPKSMNKTRQELGERRAR